MITITCPWCDDDAELPFVDTEGPEADFTCADCGTTVSFAEEPVPLDLAA